MTPKCLLSNVIIWSNLDFSARLHQVIIHFDASFIKAARSSCAKDGLSQGERYMFDRKKDER